jgi:hypothetical protein
MELQGEKEAGFRAFLFLFPGSYGGEEALGF